MLKLYRFTAASKDYWETWQHPDGSYEIHWGELGTRGSSQIIRSATRRKAERTIKGEIERMTDQGFHPLPPESHTILVIEYAIEGMGTVSDLDKRHRLEARMDETLGWTGLGSCDGGSIGSGTMEVFNVVVDVPLAKQVIEADLAQTEFADYTRIVDVND